MFERLLKANLKAPFADRRFMRLVLHMSNGFFFKTINHVWRNFEIDFEKKNEIKNEEEFFKDEGRMLRMWFLLIKMRCHVWGFWLNF